jgi:hypothetical protein
MNPIITVLHEDNHVLGVLKPAGLLAQGDRTGDPTALAQVREYIRVTYGKPGEAFVGLVHRIDRPVSGVMVFARTSKAASRLARAFHDRTVEKSYLAVVIGEMPAARGDLAGFVARDHTRSRMTYADRSGARDAALSYRVLGGLLSSSLVEAIPRLLSELCVDTPARVIYRQIRSSFLRFFALTPTPACKENPSTLPNNCLDDDSGGSVSVLGTWRGVNTF